MSTSAVVVILLVGIAVGILVGWLLRGAKGQVADVDQLASVIVANVRADNALDRGQASNDISQRVADSLTPLSSAVSNLSTQVHQFEKDRAESLGHLSAQVQSMSRTSAQLSDRTGKLVTALRAPHVRGRWGEIQLERVVELAGMVEHCDFDVQVGAAGVRPDMVVRLSGGRNVVVDAKAPFVAYLDALETEDPEEHEGHLRRHAHHLRNHVNQLASKSYQRSFSPTPEFVVLFVPADPFLDAALRNDPELLEHAFNKNVVLATPSTLIALLRTIALGWQREAVSEQAAVIRDLGSELYNRISTVSEHMTRLRGSIEKTVDSYNSTLASLESRVFVTARKLDELAVLPASQSKIPPTQFVEAVPRRPVHNQSDEDLSNPQ